MTQYKNKFATHKRPIQKMVDFQYDAANGAFAHKSDGTTVPLRDVLPSMVEFVGGLWRIQNDFPYRIDRIRDRDMVLVKKLPHQERMPFEYYSAVAVGYNCYGPFISGNPDIIVARYATDDGVYWGYGATIEQARAFLGIKLFDQYMDLIHAHACKKNNGRQKK